MHRTLLISFLNKIGSKRTWVLFSASIPIPVCYQKSTPKGCFGDIMLYHRIYCSVNALCAPPLPFLCVALLSKEQRLVTRQFLLFFISSFIWLLIVTRRNHDLKTHDGPICFACDLLLFWWTPGGGAIVWCGRQSMNILCTCWSSKHDMSSSLSLLEDSLEERKAIRNINKSSNSSKANLDAQWSVWCSRYSAKIEFIASARTQEYCTFHAIVQTQMVVPWYNIGYNNNNKGIAIKMPNDHSFL